TTWNVLQATTMECVQCHSHPYDPIRHEDYFKSLAFFNNTADADTWVDDPKLVTFTSQEDRERLENIGAWIKDESPAGTGGKEAADFIRFIRLPEPKIHGHTFDRIVDGGYINARYLAVEDGGHSMIKDISLRNEDR